MTFKDWWEQIGKWRNRGDFDRIEPTVEAAWNARDEEIAELKAEITELRSRYLGIDKT